MNNKFRIIKNNNIIIFYILGPENIKIERRVAITPDIAKKIYSDWF